MLGHFLTFWAYPAILPWIRLNRDAVSLESTRRAYRLFFSVGLAGAVVGHHAILRKWGTPSQSNWRPALAHVLQFLCWDHAYIWLCYCADVMERTLAVSRTSSRLCSGRFKGNRVIVIGNGPSAVAGEPLGGAIDQFDEVVRFNNFQTKCTGQSEFVGNKTTVHFSDGVLYPTYTDYHVPGATVVMSLFADTIIIGGSYIIQRAGQELQLGLTEKFLTDPEITWIPKENIDRLKKDVGMWGCKHPTSGLLAIDFFVNAPGIELPVYIHGFDFFQGPHIHYFHEHEPLWERISNNIGVNMHSPLLEKRYVEKLITEGKVRFLKDMPR